MLIAFVGDNEHGRSLIALIRAIRACPACAPQLYDPCATHRAELDRMHPEPCPDPQCPACTGDAAPAAPIVDVTPDPLMSRVHDNGDYRV